MLMRSPLSHSSQGWTGPTLSAFPCERDALSCSLTNCNTSTEYNCSKMLQRKPKPKNGNSQKRFFLCEVNRFITRQFGSKSVTSVEHSHAVSCNRVIQVGTLFSALNLCLRWQVSNSSNYQLENILEASISTANVCTAIRSISLSPYIT